MEKRDTCCFTGHRKLPASQMDTMVQKPYEEITALIDQGVKNFISGGALGFDQIAASAVLAKREENKQIRLIMALPCRDQDKFWSATQREKYAQLVSECDEIIYVSDNYYDGCMKKRNRFMVDASAYCVCAYLYPRSGTMQTVRYAQAKGISVINVAKQKTD